MANIKTEFTYNLADDYLAQTNSLGKTASWTYSGPDKIWVFVNIETGKIGDYNFLTIENDGPDYPTPEDHTKVEIDCLQEPLLATLLNANTELVDLSSLEQLEIVLPNGGTYSRPLILDPTHTYEAAEIMYDNGQWTIPWKKPWITWNDIYKIRDQFLKEAELDLRNVSTLPESLKIKLTDYINTLKNIEADWADFEPYMFIFPDYPL